jgi:DNA-binding CsgD family transcriptional regulator
MRKPKGRVWVFRTFVWITSSLTIVGLLAEDELDSIEPKDIACALVATVCFAEGVVEPIACSKPNFRPAFRGETIKLKSYGLTEREQEYVLEFLDGMSMKEIATEHCVSGSTVRTTFCSIYGKLNVKGSGKLLSLGARYKVK